MPRTCTVCGHPEREALDLALVRRVPYRTIAALYGVSKTAAIRHASEHLPELLVEGYKAAEAARADDLLAELRRIADNLERLADKAEEEGDYRTAIAGNAALLKRTELLARVRQVIQESNTVNLHLSPEWLELRAVIVGALDSHPEARGSVLRALEAGGNGRA